MKPYNTLTIHGKARRLRQMAFKALEHYDLDIKSVRLIINEQNGIFRVDTHDKQKYILRVTLPDAKHDLAHIQSEMKWLNILHEQSDINVPIPIRNQSNQWITTVETEDVPQPRHCAVFSWVDGKEIYYRRTFETWQAYGRLSAQLHDVASSLTPPDAFDIPTADDMFRFSRGNLLSEPENRQHFTDEEFDLLQYAVEWVSADTSKLYQNPDGLQVVHGDLHPWNVQMKYKKLSPIDFEDIIWGYPIQDVAISLYYSCLDDNFDDLLAGFKQGYETIAPFPEAYPGQLEIHMMARRIHILNYIFGAEEIEVTDIPDFIPRLVTRLHYLKAHFWDA